MLHAIDREDATYLLGSLAGFAFLPVLGPRFAIGAAVPLLANVLSQFPGTNTLQSHYGFLIVPFFAMGAVRLRELWLESPEERVEFWPGPTSDEEGGDDDAADLGGVGGGDE